MKSKYIAPILATLYGCYLCTIATGAWTYQCDGTRYFCPCKTDTTNPCCPTSYFTSVPQTLRIVITNPCDLVGLGCGQGFFPSTTAPIWDFTFCLGDITEGNASGGTTNITFHYYINSASGNSMIWSNDTQCQNGDDWYRLIYGTLTRTHIEITTNNPNGTVSSFLRLGLHNPNSGCGQDDTGITYIFASNICVGSITGTWRIYHNLLGVPNVPDTNFPNGRLWLTNGATMEIVNNGPGCCLIDPNECGVSIDTNECRFVHDPDPPCGYAYNTNCDIVYTGATQQCGYAWNTNTCSSELTNSCPTNLPVWNTTTCECEVPEPSVLTLCTMSLLFAFLKQRKGVAYATDTPRPTRPLDIEGRAR